MREGAKLIPLSEANKSNFGNVRFNLDIPKVHDRNGIPISDKVGIYVGGIQRLMRIGGIRELTVANSKSNERTSYEGTIVGVDDNGQALAGRFVKKKVTLYSASSQRDNMPLPHDERWSSARIELDTTAIAYNMKENGIPVRSTKTWSRHIDRALRTGLLKAGTHQLIGDINGWELRSLMSVYGLAPVYIEKFVSYAQDASIALPAGVITSNIIMKIVEKGLSKGLFALPSSQEGSRLSLFYGMQFDRAAVLYAAGASTRLAKEIREEQKK